jgi:HAD superfamily hydrolase (TIGR01509 family)
VRAVVPDADDDLIQSMLDEANEQFNASLHLAQPVEHVIELAREFHGRLPMAVVTGGYRDVIIPTLDGVEITSLFDAIVTADDVTHSKPAPDVYRTAMERLGVDPAACVAYEDSDIGIASARAAGVGRVVDVRDWPLSN